MKYILLSLFFTLSTPAFALDTNDILHGAAHFGGVYATTHASEVLCARAVGTEHRIACTIIGAAIGNTANVLYKAREGFPSDTPRAMISGALGSAAAVTMISLDW